MTTKRLPVLALVLIGALAIATSAAAKPHQVGPPAQVEIGSTGIGTDPNGVTFLLVPVHYPLQYAGRVVTIRARLISSGGSTMRVFIEHERLGSGRIRRPDRRHRFTFVHRIALTPGLTSRLGKGLSVRVFAGGPLDVNGDGVPEMRSRDNALQALPKTPRGEGLCSSLPRLNARPGVRLSCRCRSATPKSAGTSCAVPPTARRVSATAG